MSQSETLSDSALLQEELTHVGVGNLMDSKTSHLDDLLEERLREAICAHTQDVYVQQVAQIASEYSPIDLAYAASRLPPSVRHVVYENLPDWDARVQFIVNTDGATRAAVFRNMVDEEVRELTLRMPVDEAVWILDNLPDRRLRRLLSSLPPDRAMAIQDILDHDRHSAARMMTSEFFSFSPEVTIGEAAKYIRRHPGIGFSRSIFILNRSGQLQGLVPARNLIVNDPDRPLGQVMQPVNHTVTSDTSRDEVVDLAERYKIPALPVVDGDNVLVGVITYEDVVEAIEDIADETIGRMAGTRESVGAYETVFHRFLLRSPWLLVTLFGGLINASNLAFFGSVLDPWMGFAIFFVPLITGMSGNVGVQCSTVLVRSMAIGMLTSGKRSEAIAKEISIGLLTGVAFGILCGVAVYILNISGLQEMGAHPLAVASVVAAGLFGACLTATVLGVFSPLFFARMGIDPAISSGPIVTAFNDVFSMMMYFLIAKGIGTLFIAHIVA